MITVGKRTGVIGLAERETSAHYTRLATNYDKNWTHSETFADWMTREIVGGLRLAPQSRIADIGCGTGLYTRRIHSLAAPQQPILCVDPSEAMLAQIPDYPQFRKVHASAEQLTQPKDRPGAATEALGALDAILIKEAIHHVSSARRTDVIKGLTEFLAPGGHLLVVMLPVRIEYPLFADALKTFEALQPDPAAIADDMRTSGLDVILSYREFALEIPKARFLTMVRNRYMSLLATFSDDQINAGVAEIDATHTEQILAFSDRFAFVLGTHKGGST
jgi:ubiquinone/menaquinone biosynthesis C-methylase UbiE